MELHTANYVKSKGRADRKGDLQRTGMTATNILCDGSSALALEWPTDV